ncbi:MAG: (Fe-S)-binding protein [Deltaproteobacteria bacterium]|jgi:Fe-S oxidoreductase|nr:(Fe-S)-binding protein [Deltaproteobacteria bacterium]
MEKLYYNPGCALVLYKPHLGEKVLRHLNKHYQPTAPHGICCNYDPKLPQGSRVINTCPGCDRRFGNLYPGVSTTSLWEILANDPGFPFPDYQGLTVSIHDACPVRGNPKVHAAVRKLMDRMRIKVVEAEARGPKSICCGDSCYKPRQPAYGPEELETIRKAMLARARSMPCEEVAVYCVSCIKSMHIGGRKPRYLVDLLFGESTDPQGYETLAWHKEVEDYQDRHCS